MSYGLHCGLPFARPIIVTRQSLIGSPSTIKLLFDLYGGTSKIIEGEYSGMIVACSSPHNLCLAGDLLIVTFVVALVVGALSLDHLLRARPTHLYGLLSA